MSGRVVDFDVDFHDASGIVMTTVKPDYNMGELVSVTFPKQAPSFKTGVFATSDEDLITFVVFHLSNWGVEK